MENDKNENEYLHQYEIIFQEEFGSKIDSEHMLKIVLVCKKCSKVKKIIVDISKWRGEDYDIY